MNAVTKAEATTAPAAPAQRPGLIQAMASKYSIEPSKFLGTLKATILAKATDEEVVAFCMVAHEYGLNPFLKEIHAFPNKAGGITPVVSVDGWASLMNRRADFDGIEFEANDTEDGKPYSVTARIYLKGRSRPVSVTEFYSECQRGTEPWRTMPRRMLRHKALIQCARVAFGFCGIHDEDEARDIIDVTPTGSTTSTATTTTGTATAFRKARPVTQDPTPATTAQADPAPVNPIAPAPDSAATSPAVATLQSDLAGILSAAGFTIDDLNRFAVDQQIATAEFASYDDIPDAVAAKLVRAKAGLLRGLAQQKGGA